MLQANYRVRNNSNLSVIDTAVVAVNDSTEKTTKLTQTTSKESTTSPFKLVASALASPMRKRSDKYEVTAPGQELRGQQRIKKTSTAFLDVPKPEYGLHRL